MAVGLLYLRKAQASLVFYLNFNISVCPYAYIKLTNNKIKHVISTQSNQCRFMRDDKES